MTYSVLEQKAGKIVTQVFGSPHGVQYPYHNLQHTQAVVAHAKQINTFYQLEERDSCIIAVAAWFHDVGQLTGDIGGHEERSVAFMENFLSSVGAPAELIQPVKDGIMATRLGTLPNTMNEKILCDADTWHFGTPYFHETEFLIKKEIEIRTGRIFEKWHEGSLELLKNHVYFTEYAQLLLAKGKQENIEWLKSLIAGQKL